MKKAHRELQTFIESLPRPLYGECLASIHGPVVALQERVLLLQGPFARLRFEQAGFDPLIRFIIDRAEAGDPLAIKTRAEVIARERARGLEPPASPPTDYWKEFFTLNEEAWNRFHRTAAPWLFSDSMVLDMSRFQRDTTVDDELNAAVLTELTDFGFRRLARSFQTNTLGEPLIIRWDKGTWSMSMSLFLEMPHRRFFAPLGIPFSSGACFDFSMAARVGPRLRAFFRVLRTVFPDLLEAILEGMHAQDAFLERARNGAA